MINQLTLPCHVGAAVTLQLDAATDDVYSVDIRAPSSPNEAFDYTQVWLSPTPNYAAGTLCGRGVCFLEGQQDTAAVPGAVLCPPASNTRYVTIVKPLYSSTYWVPNGDQLALDEVVVNLGGAWVPDMRKPTAFCASANCAHAPCTCSLKRPVSQSEYMDNKCILPFPFKRPESCMLITGPRQKNELVNQLQYCSKMAARGVTMR